MCGRVCVLFGLAYLFFAAPFLACGQETASTTPPESKEGSIVVNGSNGSRVHMTDYVSCLAHDTCGDCAPPCVPVEICVPEANNGGWLSNINFSAWVAQGVTCNFGDPPNNSNAPVTFNDRANEYQMNQMYLTLERSVPTSGCCWEFGGRVDLLYGTDYFFTTAIGMETHSDGSQRWNGTGPRAAGPGSAALYGLAMPQVYGEVYAPFAGGINLKLGHFYSPLGYERVMAPENYFYSHSYAFQYGEPFTHTGALAEHQLSDTVQLALGATMGWNSWDSARSQWGIVGGVRWASQDDRTSLAWMFHAGEDGPPGVNNPAFFAGPVNPNNVTVYSLVLTRRITDRVQYVFQHDLGVEQDGEFSGGTFNAAKWYGINQYLLYDVNDCWSLGFRFEWFRDQDNSRVIDLAIASPLVTGGNYYALTLGGNWTPWQNVLVRPEIRWDWSDTESPVLGLGGPFHFFSEDKQLTAAFDVIVRF